MSSSGIEQTTEEVDGEQQTDEDKLAHLMNRVDALEDTQDEQAAEISQQGSTINDVEARVGALNKKVNRVVSVLVGDADDFGVDDIDKTDDLMTRFDKVEEAVEEAVAVAQTRAVSSGTGGTKKEHAATLSRNEVVVQAVVKGNSDRGSVTTTKVEDMAKPDVRLDSRTILDAWDDLQETWSCFNVQSGTPGPHGDASRLTVEAEDIPTPLLRAVKNNLTDETVNEALIMKIKSNGGN